jgi:hypothetical protein
MELVVIPDRGHVVPDRGRRRPQPRELRGAHHLPVAELQ